MEHERLIGEVRPAMATATPGCRAAVASARKARLPRSGPTNRWPTARPMTQKATMAASVPLPMSETMSSQNLKRTSEEFVSKFFEHTMWIAAAMDRVGDNHDDMWDEEDGFFYDVLRLPDGRATRLKVRSMVGLLPLTAVSVFEEDILTRLPTFRRNARRFLARMIQVNGSLTKETLYAPGVEQAALKIGWS